MIAMDGQKFERRPIVLQIDSWKKDNSPERSKIIVPAPIASTFRVTNGKYMAIITIDELGVEVRAFDKAGNEEKFITKKLSL